MTDVAIRAEGLSKQYRIGSRQRYKTLRDTLTDALHYPARTVHRSLQPSASRHMTLEPSTIWALTDVSFDVKRGEVLGVLGHNGAGKSTLLKILSRVTDPTAGSVDIYGRVGSLLEVGIGFNPELTGRENIYLNGAILGMHRAEISHKFDDIVDFSGNEAFLDTPVKHYSSGMYMRLAFSVATHLETSILIVDEVLAVGDAQFQKKCFNKMRSIGRDGRTIVFVSHNMAALRSICDRGIVLEHGRLTFAGDIDTAAEHYFSQETVAQSDGQQTASFVVKEVLVQSDNGTVPVTFAPVDIEVRFVPKRDIHDPGLYVGILTADGKRIAGLDFKDLASAAPIRAGVEVTLGFAIDALPLLPGEYLIEVHLKDMADHLVEIVPQASLFRVATTPVYGSRSLDSWFGTIGLKARPIERSSAVHDANNVPA